MGGGTGGTDWIFYQETGSDALNIFGNSSNRMVINTSGDIGIGTTPSTARLAIYKASADVIQSLVSDNGYNTYINYTGFSSGLSFGRDGGTGHFRWNNAVGLGGTQIMTLTTGADLLVNTTYAGGKLSIASAGGSGVYTIYTSASSIVNPNSTGSEIVGANITVGSNIILSERQPNGAYADRTDLVIRTNTGYGVGQSDKFRFSAGGTLTYANEPDNNYLNMKGQSSGGGISWNNYMNVFSEYSSGASYISSNYYPTIGAAGYKTTLTATFGAAGMSISGTSGAGNGGLIQFFVSPAISKTAGAAFSPTEVARFSPAGNFSVGDTGAFARITASFAGKASFAGLDTSAYAAGVGGTIDLGGNYRTSGDYSAFVRIAAEKANATDGDYGYNMGFYVTSYPNATFGVKAMTINSTGNLLVGTTSNSTGARLNVVGLRAARFESTQANTAGIVSQCNSANNDEPAVSASNINTSGSGLVTFYSSLGGTGASNTNCFHLKAITQGSAIYYLYGNGTSSFTSDARLKKNITTTRDGYAEDLCKLRVVKYNWNGAPEGEAQELGLIAQEVEQVFPNLVIDAADKIQGITPKVLKSSVLPFMLLKAIQEQQAIIESLKARLDAANL